MKLLFILLMPIFFLRASEIALLLEIKNNSLLYFSIKNREHLCIPYGIITFDILQYKSKDNALCQKALLEYYDKYPKDKNFAKKHFHTQQYYNIEKKKSSCIIYAKGKKSYSSILLEKGLAIVPTHFKDKIFEYKYRKIENEAKISQKGLWSNPILRNCISQIEL